MIVRHCLANFFFSQRLHVHKKKTELPLNKARLYNILSALFIAVGYVAAQAPKVQNFYYAITT